ncbi:MAG: acyl-CoA dehydratase activase, partial [Peptococcaceae bacterium]|nr:acyl-CoA dehydratase activase [Peptococcaceae bacterium]
MIRIGLDVGSTTMKCVVLDDEQHILFKDYRRHRSNIKECAVEFLEDIKKALADNDDKDIRFAITGSAGIGLSEAYHIPFIQEVVASQMAVKELNSDVDVAIELGGEDAKILFLTGGSEVRMNGSCAGGTGAFIDQMAVLLNVDLETLNTLANESETVYNIASRCGVFAKSDIQPLLNQGARKEDVAMSIFYAVANQTVGGLAQGREIKGRVIFLGGPLNFFSALQTAFKNVLKLKSEDDYIFPDNAQYYVAMGAALYSKNELTFDLDALEKRFAEPTTTVRQTSNTQPLFNNEAEYTEFMDRHAKSTVQYADIAHYKGDAYLGIDAGSTTVKIVVIGKNNELLYSRYENNNGQPINMIKETLGFLYKNYPDIHFCSSAVTGYGEELIKTAFSLDYGLVETMAHLTAAQYFQPDVDFIIDIGGQDMKCFKIKNGTIDSIFLNEACSSGCGSFISTFASAMGYDVETFANLGIRSQHPVDLGSRCTVFMNSSVKQSQKEGASVEDISAGLSISVVKNALYKVIRANDADDLGKRIVVQGGTFYNNAILRAFEKEIGRNVIRPSIAGLMGAFGCAIYAKNNSKGETKCLNAAQLSEFSFKTYNRTCQLCGNHCELTINHFSNGQELIAGNRCERPLNKEKKNFDLPNAYLYKQQLITNLKKEQLKGDFPNGTVGLPLGLNMYEMYPFWVAFWNHLGYRAMLSPFGSKKLFQEGQYTIPSDTVCYPAKLIHGHIEYLLNKKVDFIFYPCLTYNFDEHISQNHYNCPVVAYYPQVIEANVQKTNDQNFAYGFYGIHNKKFLKKQLAKDWAKRLGVSSRTIGKAVDAAYAAQEAYYAKQKTFTKQAIDYARVHNLQVIILAGRPYHVDPEINHGIDRLIQSFDSVVISEDGLDFIYDDQDTHVLNQWTYHARLYNAAKYVNRNEDFSLVQLVSFGCGLDAITADE